MLKIKFQKIFSIELVLFFLRLSSEKFVDLIKISLKIQPTKHFYKYFASFEFYTFLLLPFGLLV